MAGETKARKSPRKQVAQLQAAAEGVQSGETVEFLGEDFRLAEKIGALPLMKMAAYDMDGSIEGMWAASAAMYAMLQDTIHGDDWDRFERHAVKCKADMNDLQVLVRKCLEAITARPTRRPSGSSNGDSPASASSTATSSSAPGAA